MNLPEITLSKKNILIGSGILLGLIILCLTIFLISRPKGPTPREEIQKAFELQSTPAVLGTPTVNPTPVTTTITPEAEATIIVDNVSMPVSGTTWTIYQIVYQAYEKDGYKYDVGTFWNTKTGETLTAHCAEPNWPSPPLGTVYKINEAGVLIPVSENPQNPFQRFIFIK